VAVAGILGAAACSCVLHIALPPEGRTALLTTVQAVGAVVCVAGILWHHPPRRRQWWALMLGALTLAGGWHALAAGRPGLVALTLVAAYVLVGHGGLLIGQAIDSRRSLFGLDLAMLATVAFTFAWHVQHSPWAVGDSAQNIWVAVQLAGDLTLMAVVWRVLARRPRWVPSFGYLIAAAALLLAWHGAVLWGLPNGAYEPGAGSDVLVIAPWGLLGAATWHPSMREVGRPSNVLIGPEREGMPLALPVVFVLPALPLLAELGLIRTDRVVFAASTALTISLLLVRTALVTRTATSQARTDPLTGLANRRMLQATLAHRLAQPEGAPSTLLLLDLDRFKAVNDTHGHAAGDQLLREVATRLRRAAPRDSIVCRMGGDEFAVLTSGVGAEPAAEQVLSAFQTPLSIGTTTLQARVSVGVAPVVVPPELDVDDAGALFSASAGLLVDADLALYEAKRGGGGAVNAARSQRERHEREQALWEGLPLALDTGEGLVAHYQPIVDLATGRVGTVEALARWHHPERGFLPPNDFLDVAHRLGLMRKLDEVMLRTAARDLAIWRAAGVDDLCVSVNLSAASLLRPDLVEFVTASVTDYGTPVSSLLLEITEHDAIPEDDSVSARLRRLRDDGVFVALDDFGVGYASMGYLARFPVSGIKLDKSLVQRVHEPRGRELLTGVVALSHSLDTQVLAEGVETAAQEEAVRELGFDFGQGFYYAHPMAADRISPWVRAWRRASAVPLQSGGRGAAALPRVGCRSGCWNRDKKGAITATTSANPRGAPRSGDVSTRGRRRRPRGRRCR
jgi:diguanylate cyclase (GGDEF)-like protein